MSLEFGGALFVVAVGYGAHSFKQKSKKWYGRIEILFATLYASYNIAKVEDPVKPTPRDLAVFWMAIFGSAYIVARDLGNIGEAKSKTKYNCSGADPSSGGPTSSPAPSGSPPGQT